MKLINIKTKEEINLPKIKSIKDIIEIPRGTKHFKKFFKKSELGPEFISIPELKRLGFKLIRANIGNYNKMYKGQEYRYYLKYIDEKEEMGEMECKVLPEKEVRIKFVRLKRGGYKVRLEGKGTNYSKNNYVRRWWHVE